MPYFADGIDLNTKYRNNKTRSTPGNRLECSLISRGKLGPIEGKSPQLPATHPRLLMNLRYDGCETC
jgi:hypothetical protein